MRLSGLVVAAALVASIEARGQTPTLEGIWALDVKASKNVPESQKGLDLKIGVKGDQFSTVFITGAGPVGTPLVYTLDGKSRQMDLGGGTLAQVSARWVVNGTKIEQVVSLPVPGSVVFARHRTLTELSPDGARLIRTQEVSRAGEATDRILIYKRKE